MATLSLRFCPLPATSHPPWSGFAPPAIATTLAVHSAHTATTLALYLAPSLRTLDLLVLLLSSPPVSFLTPSFSVRTPDLSATLMGQLATALTRRTRTTPSPSHALWSSSSSSAPRSGGGFGPVPMGNGSPLMSLIACGRTGLITRTPIPKAREQARSSLLSTAHVLCSV